MRARVAAALALLTLAGCLSVPSDPGADPAPRGPFVDPIVDEHDHADPLEHAFTTASMEELGFTTMTEDGTPFSYIGEIDYQGDFAYVIVLGRGSTPGFAVIDVSDATNLRPVGRAEHPTAYVVDVKVDDAGEFVYLASQAGAPAGADPALVTDPAALGRNGVTVWDVRDKTAPKLVSSTPTAPFGNGGCHMLAYKVIGGDEYLFCADKNVLVFRVEADHSLALVGQYTTTRLDADKLVADDEFPARSPSSHDMTVQDDPLTGEPIMLVSNWNQGLRVVDVSDPANPVEIGAWNGEGATEYQGNVHTAIATAIDGNRFVVVGPELLSTDRPPAMWVLDATDWGALEVAAEWIPPGAHASQGLLLTTHQYQVLDGRMYLAYNHAGVWVVDLRALLAGGFADDVARPEVLGYHLPRSTVEPFDPEGKHPVPNTWDVVVRNGVILATDRYTGLYALHYKPDPIGDAALSSFA